MERYYGVAIAVRILSKDAQVLRKFIPGPLTPVIQILRIIKTCLLNQAHVKTERISAEVNRCPLKHIMLIHARDVQIAVYNLLGKNIIVRLRVILNGNRRNAVCQFETCRGKI